MKFEDKVRLWDAINRYVVSAGGDPASPAHMKDNKRREEAVVEVENLVVEMQSVGIEVEIRAHLKALEEIAEQWKRSSDSAFSMAAQAPPEDRYEMRQEGAVLRDHARTLRTLAEKFRFNLGW